MARRAIYFNAGDRPVAPESHRQNQCAVELAPSRLGIIERADAFDLAAPLLDVLGKAVFVGARADELLARSLVVLVELLADRAFEAGHGQRARRQIAAADRRRRFGLHLLLWCRGDHRPVARLRGESLLSCFEFLNASLRVLEVAAIMMHACWWQRRRRDMLLLGVAAAVETGLRQHLRFGRLSRRPAIDQHDLERPVLEGPRRVREGEVQRQQQRVRQQRDGQGQPQTARGEWGWVAFAAAGIHLNQSPPVPRRWDPRGRPPQGRWFRGNDRRVRGSDRRSSRSAAGSPGRV